MEARVARLDHQIQSLEAGINRWSSQLTLGELQAAGAELLKLRVKLVRLEKRYRDRRVNYNVADGCMHLFDGRQVPCPKFCSYQHWPEKMFRRTITGKWTLRKQHVIIDRSK